MGIWSSMLFSLQVPHSLLYSFQRTQRRLRPSLTSRIPIFSSSINWPVSNWLFWFFAHNQRASLLGAIAWWLPCHVTGNAGLFVAGQAGHNVCVPQFINFIVHRCGSDCRERRWGGQSSAPPWHLLPLVTVLLLGATDCSLWHGWVGGWRAADQQLL